MRPARPGDLPRLVELLQGDVAAGRSDSVPGEARMRAYLERFDWEARSRVVEDGRRISAAVLVSARSSPDGLIAQINVAGPPEPAADLMRWAMGLSRAGGARIAQVYAARGARHLDDFGLRVVRPWLRMDRTLGGPLPAPRPAGGYSLVDGRHAPQDMWATMFNRSFADHWRFTPRSEDEIVAGKPPELCLMALTSPGHEPAAITFGEVEDYVGDARPQPVGLVSSVGTVPEHRRHGLAHWLVGEVVRRLQAAGARSASLYVDGMSPMRAFDVYRNLGFEVTYEADVWEASFP